MPPSLQPTHSSSPALAPPFSSSALRLRPLDIQADSLLIMSPTERMSSAVDPGASQGLGGLWKSAQAGRLKDKRRWQFLAAVWAFLAVRVCKSGAMQRGCLEAPRPPAPPLGVL